jgi:hypothetical protein
VDKTLAFTYIKTIEFKYYLNHLLLEKHMSLDRMVFAFAGTFILISLVLAHFVSPMWLWLTAFVGANMLQTAFTGFCPLVIILKKLGVKPGQAFN